MRAELLGIDRALDGLLEGLDVELPEAVTACAKLTADEAARQHAYTSRSGDLEKRTVPGVTSGTFSQGTLHGEALGDMPYGKFVDEGTTRSRAYPFLAPAAARTEGDAAREIERGAEQAARRAGWGT